jgi:hypothetical protein
MLEMGTSGLMSGEGKPSAACRSRLSALPRLYGPKKTREMAHNTGFLGMARPGSAGLGLPFGGENVGRRGPSLRLSLPGRHLVNSVAGALAPTNARPSYP